jgi:hypothetical protein
MKTKLLYLDIDGVLLGKNEPDSIEVVLARYAKEFLTYCLQNYDCYWLTTHCKEKDTTALVNYLREYADRPVIELIKAIKPISWKTLKTEAIDFSSDFYWIDNELLQCEVEILRQNKVLNRWIEVDTRKHPDDLKRAISILKELNGNRKHKERRKNIFGKRG